MAKHNRKQTRKIRDAEERLAKSAEQKEKKRMGKTERWAGNTRPAAYGKPPRINVKWGHFDQLKG